MVAHKPAVHSATGRRKTSVARVRLVQGDGKVVVNGVASDKYFPLATLRNLAMQPLKLVDRIGQYNVTALVDGGGLSGQAGAMRHGIARALVQADEAFKSALKGAGFLTRDPRMKERKKSGQPGARKRFQFSKR